MRLTSKYFEKWREEHISSIMMGNTLNNNCLNSLNNLCANEQWVRGLGLQLYHVVLGFPFHIAGAIATSRDEKLLSILVSNLYSEIGSGIGRDHISIYRDFLRYLQLPDAHPIAVDSLWEETIALEEACKVNYMSERIGIKLGALFAFECMSSPMVEKWHIALSENNYPPSTFKFFTIHIEVEKEHVDDILQLCEKYIDSEDFEKDFSEGVNRVNRALVAFWSRAFEFRKECS